MKKLFTFFMILLLTINVVAQPPQKMSYQAVIRNASNALVRNHVIGVKISILQDSEDGTPVYIETHNPTSDVNGLITIEIGEGTSVTGTFAFINWGIGTYFLKIDIDLTGSTNYTITGVNQILSVPYSFYANKAKDVVYKGRFLYVVVYSSENGYYREFWTANIDGTGKQKIAMPQKLGVAAEEQDVSPILITPNGETLIYVVEEGPD
jgi:hypothetical protein